MRVAEVPSNVFGMKDFRFIVERFFLVSAFSTLEWQGNLLHTWRAKWFTMAVN